MKVSRKIIPLLLTLILVLSIFSAVAVAESAPAEDTVIPPEAELVEEEGDEVNPPIAPPTDPPVPPTTPPTPPTDPPVQPTQPPNPQHIKSLIIKGAPSRLATGKSRQLRAEVQNFAHQVIDKNVAWMSDNPRVLTVSPRSGMVRAKNPGTATIIARTMTQDGVLRTYATIEVVSRNNDVKILSGGRYYATYMWEYSRTNNSEDPPIAALAPPINLRNTWRALRPIPYTTKTYIAINGQTIDSSPISAMVWDSSGKPTTVDYKNGGTYLFRFEYGYMDGVDEVAGHAYYKLRIPPR